MRLPKEEDFVRLTNDIPELSLNRGQVGIVRGRIGGQGRASEIVYEVEFHQVGHDYETRTLLWSHQLEIEEGSLMTPAGVRTTSILDCTIHQPK